jgi:hypothetical protein
MIYGLTVLISVAYFTEFFQATDSFFLRSERSIFFLNPCLFPVAAIAPVIVI